MTGICARCGYEIENDSEKFDTCPRCGDPDKGAVVFTLRGNRENDPTFTPYPDRLADLFTAKRREQDVDMMKKPQHWPSHVLAMKRYRPIDGRVEFAVYDGVTLLVGAAVVEGQIIANAKEQIVATPEEIVEQGWTVD